jgi:uncharacterized protein YcfL
MNTRTVLPILLLALASGCVTKSETVKTAYPPVERQTVVDKRIIIDSGVAGSVRLVGVKSSVGADGYLKIQINVQSLLDSPRPFDYRIDWFDSRGLALPLADATPMTWMFLPHETAFLAQNAPTPAARDFRMILFAHAPAH